MRTKNLLVVVLLLAAGLLFVWSFSHLPTEDSRLAIDWKQIWQGTHGFRVEYTVTELRTPPWLLPLIWPFTLLPLGLSWGLAAFVTLIVLIISVPRDAGTKKWLLGLFTMATSYLALRQLIDGNLEVLVIGGALLLLLALERKSAWLLVAGLVLASAKIQETWLLLIAMAVVIAKAWPRRQLLKAFAIVLTVALPFLIWKGSAWLNAMIYFPWPGTAIDSSLQATLARLGLPRLLYWILWLGIMAATIYFFLRRGWQLGRLEAGFLVTAGLLLGPYAASNSVLTPFAIGAIPFFQKRVWRGTILIALVDLPYLFLGRPELRQAWEANYWTGFLLIVWFLLILQLTAPAN